MQEIVWGELWSWPEVCEGRAAGEQSQTFLMVNVDQITSTAGPVLANGVQEA